MNTISIRTLKPNVSQSEALACFSAAGFSALYWRVRGGPLRRIADVYVPFSLYTVRYKMAGAVRSRVFAMDAVHGSLDLFQFPRVPQAAEFITVATRNFLPVALSAARAEELLRHKVLRVIFQQGFFKLRDPQLQITNEHVELHIPYWLGFYGNHAVKCRVLDAVRRRFEGAKACAFFEECLAA
jgi:hypothetical protein